MSSPEPVPDGPAHGTADGHGPAHGTADGHGPAHEHEHSHGHGHGHGHGHAHGGPGAALRVNAARALRAARLAYLFDRVVPTPVLRGFARGLGMMAYGVDGELRAIVERNLQLVYGARGPEEVARIARDYFRYRELRRLILSTAPHLTHDDLHALLEPEGLDRLDAALQGGKGVVLLGSHLNSAFGMLLSGHLRSLGYDATAVHPDYLAKDREKRRSARERAEARLFGVPVELLAGDDLTTQLNIRPTLQALARNRVVISIGDAFHAASFVHLPFLGRKIPFATGPMSVARLAGSPVLTFACLGNPTEGMRLVIEEPIEIPSEGRPQQQVATAMAEFARRLEAHMEVYPHTWERWAEPDVLDEQPGWLQASVAKRYKPLE